VLLEADAAKLEVVCAAYLSQDPVLCQEIREGVDIHGNNQKRFNLPDKVIAKIFVFRLIYGGSAFSYAKDKEFNWISDDPKYWQKIIDEFYNKYQGVAQWHESIVSTASKTGRLVMPTGRIYTFQPYWKRDKWVWPRTTILNYPVQGLGADLLAIARVSAYRRLKGKCLFINTVHDSIVVDVDNNPELCYDIWSEFNKVFDDIPENFEKLFGVEFNLPMRCESKMGVDWLNMKVINSKEDIDNFGN
jgi:DNA polymerase I-like protein with 3'-5' exonuclease and polymerase domains